MLWGASITSSLGGAFGEGGKLLQKCLIGRASRVNVGPEILWETLIVTLFWPFRRSSPRTEGVGA